MSQGMIEMVLGPRAIEPLNFSETLIIGRDPAACHVALEDHRISAVHCRIEIQRGVFTLIDLGSANNTFLNGEKVSRQPLKSGDLIKLGSYVLMFNQMEGTASKLAQPQGEEDSAPVGRTIAGPRRPTGATGKIAGRPDGEGGAIAQGKTFGRFEVRGEIGRGGMGVIYKVVDIKSKTNREYALKALPGGSFAGREVVERFMDEARALSRIKQDGVVRIYKIDEENGTPYYVMDFIDGQTLEKRLESGKKFAPDEALMAIRQIADIIGGVHQTGLIHRDLTPNNVIYERDSNKAWIVDFGLARDLMVRERLTRTGELIGTPHYVSPEQAEGDLKAVDRRTDIYAMGAILYRLLTGSVPFDGESVPQIVMKVLLEDVKPPRQHVKEIPLKIEAICLRALAKDREARYPSAEALVADIDRYFRGEPIEAPQLTVASLVGKAAWKVRLVLGLLAVLVGFILVLTVNYSQRILAFSSYRREKLSLFLQGGDKHVSTCAIAEGSPPQSEVASELAWWNEWKTRLTTACESVQELGAEKRYLFNPLAPASDSIGRLKRLRDALALYQAALDLDAGNERATAGIEKINEQIVKNGEAELEQAKKWLARERAAGAIFHALRALEHVPQLPEPIARQARDIIGNARRNTQVTTADDTGADQKLPVRIYPADAPELGADGPAETTPLPTRKAGPLLFCVGPAGDSFWFALELDKAVTALDIQYRPRPAELRSAYRLMEVKKKAESQWQVVQAAYLLPDPPSQETLTLLAEIAGVDVDAGTDPRAPGLVAVDRATALCTALAARLATKTELEQWLRFMSPTNAPARVIATEGGTAAAFDVHGARLDPAPAGPAAIIAVVAAGSVAEHAAAFKKIDASRVQLREQRAAMIAAFETVITRIVEAVGAGDWTLATSEAEALATSIQGPAPFKVLEKSRAEMRALAALLVTGVSGKDAALRGWLEALAKGDQQEVVIRSSAVSAHIPQLQRLFVYFDGRWYPSKQKAQAAGALYFEESSGEWLPPLEAVKRGFVFAGNQWRTAEEASSLGLGTLVERGGGPRWIDRNSALAEGYAYWTAQKQWRKLEELWAAAPAVKALEGDFLAARLLANDSIVLLAKQRETSGETFWLSSQASPEAPPTWRVKLKVTSVRSTPRELSCSGNTIAVIYSDEVRLFNASTGDPGRRIETRSSDTVVVSPSGAEIAVGKGVGEVEFFEVATTNPPRVWNTGRTKPILSLGYSPDGVSMLVGFASGEIVKLVDRSTSGRPILQPKLEGITQVVMLSKTLDEDLRAAAAGKPPLLWLYAKGQEAKKTGHSGGIVSIVALKGERYLLTAGTDARLLLWSVEDGTPIAKLSSPDVKQAQTVAEMASSGDWILSHGGDGIVRIWTPQ